MTTVLSHGPLQTDVPDIRPTLQGSVGTATRVSLVAAGAAAGAGVAPLAPPPPRPADSHRDVQLPRRGSRDEHSMSGPSTFSWTITKATGLIEPWPSRRPRPTRPPLAPATAWGETHVQRRDRLGSVVHGYILAA